MSEEIAIAFDASGAGLCVAVGSPQGVLATVRRPGPRGQVEELNPALEACLADAELGWGAITRIGVVRGPGSFVGVRVGIAAARGLALGTDAPAFGIDGFEAAALSALHHGQLDAAAAGACFAVVFGAGDRFIWRRFAHSVDGLAALSDPESGDTEALEQLGLARKLGPGVDAQWPGAHGGALIELAFAAGEAENPPRPFYARPPDAAPPSRTPLPRLSSAG